MKPPGFWRKIENQRIFFNELAVKLSIKTPSDWGQYTSEIVASNGGRTMSSRYHGSLQDMLKTLYPNIEWKLQWFVTHNGHWRNVENQREFLLRLAKENNLEFPSGIPKLTQKEIVQNGGISMLKSYNWSSSTMLQHLFPEIEWKSEWFTKVPHKYWSLIPNQRSFFDSLARKLKIKNPKDWGNISTKLVLAHGGGIIVGRYYPTLFDALKKIYPDVKWNREWFSHLSKYEKSFFRIPENQKSFLNELASDYGIESANDWNRITVSVIKRRGGQALLKKYKSSIAALLNSVYGNSISQSLQSANQRSTQKTIESLFGSSFM